MRQVKKSGFQALILPACGSCTSKYVDSVSLAKHSIKPMLICSEYPLPKDLTRELDAIEGVHIIINERLRNIPQQVFVVAPVQLSLSDEGVVLKAMRIPLRSEAKLEKVQA